MSRDEKETVHPTHQVSFARITGKDREGRDVLGPARQIGAIWPRAGKENDGIIRLDHMPEELRSQGGGVLFVRKIEAQREERPASKERDQDHER